MSERLRRCEFLRQSGCTGSNVMVKQIAHHPTIHWARVFGAVCAACILMFFFTGAGQGLAAYFTTDDLVNMNYYQSQPVSSIVKANILFFSPSYRPLGGLFYRSLFAVFGFDPWPYRIGCFLLLTINLALAWRVADLVTGSTRSCEHFHSHRSLSSALCRFVLEHRNHLRHSELLATPFTRPCACTSKFATRGGFLALALRS